MIEIPVAELQKAACEDPELRLAGRYLDTCVELGIGKARYCIHIHDGEVLKIEASDFARRHSYPSTITIEAPEDDWKKLLEPVPPPYYQDLWGAQVHHGFEIGGDRMTFYAYYRAVGRLLELLRESYVAVERETGGGGPIDG